MARYNYQEAISKTDLRLDGNQILAYTTSNAYNGIAEGYQAFDVTSEAGEYRISEQGDLEAVVAYTEGTRVFILMKPQSPYHAPVWSSSEQLTTDKQVELIKAFKVFAHNHYSFGGHSPYIEVLSGVFAETTVPAPIGEAIIGEDFIVS